MIVEEATVTGNIRAVTALGSLVSLELSFFGWKRRELKSLQLSFMAAII